MTSEGTGTILRADARRIPLADQSVDLIITSPPYFALRSYSEGGEHYEGQIGCEPTPQVFLGSLWAVMHECWRVLKPSGSCFINLGDKRCGYTNGQGKGRRFGSGERTVAHVPDGPRSAPTVYGIRNKSKMLLPHRFAIGCEDGLADPEGKGWVVRQDLVWQKTNGMPESVTDRTRDSHEYVFHLTKRERYFAAVDALGRLPGSVWPLSSEPLAIPSAVKEFYELPDHFASFPQELPRKIILGWSSEHAVVLDPFVGTGTTVGVARALGRYGIGLDLSSDYCRLARWRVFESGHFAKTIRRTNAANQGSLL